MKQNIEVPAAPPLAVPNNGNLPPTSDVTVLVLMLLLTTVKAYSIRERRLLIQAEKERLQPPDKK